MEHTYKGKTYDIPYRDSRRQKCYDGERACFGYSMGAPIDKDRSLEAAEAFATKVLNSAAWMRLRKDHGKLNPAGECWIRQRGWKIKDGRGTTFARGGGNRLNLPRWARTKPVILHEIAHCLVGAGNGHHWPFNRAFIDLVNVFMGRETGTKLERCLKAAGAKTRPPKQLSEEHLAKLRAASKKGLAAIAKKREEK